VLEATKSIARAQMHGAFGGERKDAIAQGVRRSLSGGSWVDLPLYRVEDQLHAVQAEGPCVLEEAFFTCRIESGWRFEINEARDILVSRS
jgi:N-methylhydantoinase A